MSTDSARTNLLADQVEDMIDNLVADESVAMAVMVVVLGRRIYTSSSSRRAARLMLLTAIQALSRFVNTAIAEPKGADSDGA